MSKKDDIVVALLDSVDDPEELEEVFRRYSSSKGPFYLALAEATSQLDDDFRNAVREATDAATQKTHRKQELDSQSEQKGILDREVQTRHRQLEESQVELGQVQGLLDQAGNLTRQGFGEKELTSLSGILGEIAASQGGTSEEGVAQFFQTVERYEHVLSLDLEAQRVEARMETSRIEAQRWEAEARSKESQSKARISTIDLMEKLLDQGVKADDLPHWQGILMKAGVSVEELATALEQYASLESLVQGKQKEAVDLEHDVSESKVQVQAVAQERADIHRAIVALKDRAVSEMTVVEKRAQQHVDSLVREATAVGQMRAEAADLGEYLEAARLVKSGNHQSWQKLPREVIQQFLLIAIKWCEVEARDAQVTVPKIVRNSSLLPSYASLRLSQVLQWAFAGTLTHTDLEALVKGR